QAVRPQRVRRPYREAAEIGCRLSRTRIEDVAQPPAVHLDASRAVAGGGDGAAVDRQRDDRTIPPTRIGDGNGPAAPEHGDLAAEVQRGAGDAGAREG